MKKRKSDAYSPRGFGPLSTLDDLSTAEQTTANNNVQQWLNQDGGNLRSNNLSVCQYGIDWVKTNGLFSSSGGSIDFDDAMSVGTGSLSSAFQRSYLVGILAKEWYFATMAFPAYDPTDPTAAIGGFQIKPQYALAEFNKTNSPTLAPTDIDKRGSLADSPLPYGSFRNAAAVAAWYLAENLQAFTFKKYNGNTVGAISDTSQAALFAIASYNQGTPTIQNARIDCAGDGKDNTDWDTVKTYLSDDVKKYVALVCLYGAGLN